jgi:aspartate kinase
MASAKRYSANIHKPMRTPFNIRAIKFGGSSLKDDTHLSQATDFIGSIARTGTKVAVVVSAQADVTDEFIRRMRKVAPSLPSREYDAYVSLGENLSAPLFAASLIESGVQACSLNSYQAGILTNGIHKHARILSINTDLLLSYFITHGVIVLPGFQGVGPDSSITTIGRGGSDTTAVALACALGLQDCLILTDVDGIFSADPNSLHGCSPILIQQIHYDEVCAMASLGAKVIHPRAVQLAQKHGLHINVGLASTPDIPGTTIGPFRHPLTSPVISACLDRNVALLSYEDLPITSGSLAHLLKCLTANNVMIHVVVHNISAVSPNNVDIVIPGDHIEDAVRAPQKGQFPSPTIAKDVALLSIIGGSMESSHGSAARFFGLLKQSGANIQVAASSRLSQSVILSQNECEEALLAVCKDFHLLSGKGSD